ncbi:MAG: hypothetical protein ACKORF_05145 [Micrococcales bacterium]
MNLSALSGLLVSVIALVWVGVFIPSWFTRNQSVRVENRQRRQVKASVKVAKSTGTTNIASIAQRSFQLQLLRRICKLLILAGLAGMIFASLNFEEFWPVALGSLGGCVGLAFANRAATLAYERLLVSMKSQRSTAFVARSLAVNIDVAPPQSSAKANPNAWVPVAVPAPLQKNGTLENVVLAKVSELPKPVISVEGKDLDLIMKRRRNAG